MNITDVLKKSKVGVMVCGHREYWTQFPGMYETVLENAKTVERYIEKSGVELITYTNSDGDQMVDSRERSIEAGLYFNAQDVDILFVYLTAYVASGRYMQGLMRTNCPIVVIATQVDLSKKEEVSIRDTSVGGSPCALPESYNALERCGKKPVGLLYGDIESNTRMQNEVAEWCRVANALRAYKGANFGHLGHSYNGMLDMNFDPTTFMRTFGINIHMLEMCEFVEYVQNSTDEEVAAMEKRIRDTFDILDASSDETTVEVQPEDVTWAARCSAGLFKLMEKNNLDGMAYYYEGRNDSLYERIASNMIIGNSLLTSEGRSLAGESDMKTCVAMYTTSALGCGGSFAELCFTDYPYDVQMVGHDGPHDIRISEGKPHIRGLRMYHGKRGHGISVEFDLKHGPITMFGLSSDVNGKFSFVVSEGEAVEGDLPQYGNTESRGYFGPDVSSFVERWSMAGNNHHMSLSIGHNASLLEKLAKCLGVDFVRVQ